MSVACAEPPGTQPAATQPAEASLRYRLSKKSDEWPADKRKRIVESMDAAVALYNRLGIFDKQVIANYSPGMPTADANYDGWINFGGQMNRRVALHEIGHTLGVGTHPRWGELVTEGKWTGKHALAQLREFDGPEAVLHADHQHFWPYGLNYDREGGAENERRHCLMVHAIRRDLGVIE